MKTLTVDHRGIGATTRTRTGAGGSPEEFDAALSDAAVRAGESEAPSQRSRAARTEPGLDPRPGTTVDAPDDDVTALVGAAETVTPPSLAQETTPAVALPLVVVISPPVLPTAVPTALPTVVPTTVGSPPQGIDRVVPAAASDVSGPAPAADPGLAPALGTGPAPGAVGAEVTTSAQPPSDGTVAVPSAPTTPVHTAGAGVPAEPTPPADEGSSAAVPAGPAPTPASTPTLPAAAPGSPAGTAGAAGGAPAGATAAGPAPAPTSVPHDPRATPADVDPTGVAGITLAPSVAASTAATATTGEIVATPAGLTGQVVRVSEQLRASGGGTTRLIIRLDPPELGRVTLTMTSRAGEVGVTLMVERGGAAQALGDQRQSLTAALREQGFDLSGFDVRTGGGDQREQRWQESADRRDHAATTRSGQPDRGMQAGRAGVDTSGDRTPRSTGTWL